MIIEIPYSRVEIPATIIETPYQIKIESGEDDEEIKEGDKIVIVPEIIIKSFSIYFHENDLDYSTYVVYKIEKNDEKEEYHIYINPELSEYLVTTLIYYNKICKIVSMYKKCVYQQELGKIVTKDSQQHIYNNYTLITEQSFEKVKELLEKENKKLKKETEEREKSEKEMYSEIKRKHFQWVAEQKEKEEKESKGKCIIS